MPRKPARKSITRLKRRKKPNFRSSKKAKFNRIKKRISKVTGALFIFIISAIFLSGLLFTKYITQSYASALSATSNSEFDQEFPTVSYIVAKDLEADPIEVVEISYILLDKQNNTKRTYKIPLNMQYDAPGRYGVEEFSKLFALGELGSDVRFEGGIDLISKTLFEIFAFPVNKYILIDSSIKEEFDAFLRDGNILGFVNKDIMTNLGSDLRTNVRLSEMNNLRQFLVALSEDDKISENLSFDNIQNPESLDSLTRDMTIDSSVSREKLNIAVLNATEESGKAFFGSRAIRNIGGRVVAVSNASRTYEVSCLVTDDENSTTVREVADMFGIEKVVTVNQALSKFPENEINRADITVIFGFDSEKEMY